MAQIKIYASSALIQKKREDLSEAIHLAVIDSLNYPVNKRFHRFIALEQENFIYPDDRSEQYLIIEISMFSGRSTATKKQLIQNIFRNIQQGCEIALQDIEITLFETPQENWGIRGYCADELHLDYKVSI